MHATTHATGTQIVRAKMTSLDAIFCGETSRTPALSLAFAAGKNEKSTARSDALVKKIELDL